MEASVGIEACTEVFMDLFEDFDEGLNGFLELGSAMFETAELGPEEGAILELGIGDDRVCC